MANPLKRAFLTLTFAQQRIYEWRGYFGSSALRAFEFFFQSSPHRFPDLDARAQFCKEIVEGGRLFYEGSNDGVNYGLYRSTFVLTTLSEHVDAIRGAVHVPKLYATGSKKNPYGAIGLAAAAVFRAAFLFSSRKVGYDDSKCIVVLKTVKNNGKQNTKETAFSEANCGEKTRECAISASNLTAEKIETILECAKQSVVHCPAPTEATASSSFNPNASQYNFSGLVDTE